MIPFFNFKIWVSSVACTIACFDLGLKEYVFFELEYTWVLSFVNVSTFSTPTSIHFQWTNDFDIVCIC